jgi:hypothetical protein
VLSHVSYYWRLPVPQPSTRVAISAPPYHSLWQPYPFRLPASPSSSGFLALYRIIMHLAIQCAILYFYQSMPAFNFKVFHSSRTRLNISFNRNIYTSPLSHHLFAVNTDRHIAGHERAIQY